MKTNLFQETANGRKASGRTLLVIILVLFVHANLNSYNIAHGSKDNEVVIAWNEVAYTIANEHDQFLSFIGIRALAMTHLAMHDALNAINPSYQQYAFKGKAPHADPIVAASQAASKILITVYPEKEKVVTMEIQKWLLKVPDGKAKAAGIELGNRSAEAILKLRKNDDHLAKGIYQPNDSPGKYQFTPEFDWVWIPDLKKIKPFFMTSVDQFRSTSPPPLTSSSYAESFNEVKLLGGKSSSTRSIDQTNYGHWWAEFAEHSWNRIGRITAREQQLPLQETARMFALINMAIFDIYIASFDSKYFYDTWRPITAIHSADQDFNNATEADPNWQPEMLTPPWPEYPSAHAAVAAGGAEVVSTVFGTADIPFSMESTTALPEAKVRSYINLDSAANDCASSRIVNGYHFRFATEAGKKQGREIAKYLCTNYLTPLKISANK